MLTEKKTILNHCMYFIIAIMHGSIESMCIVIMHILSLQTFFFEAKPYKNYYEEVY